ncbi:MAG: serine protease, partial [Acidobacteria bacterium]|nr:serine protease [Acidobacteriota bacterium]
MNRTKLASLPALALLTVLSMIPARAQDWVASVAQRSEPAVVTVVSYDGDNNKIGFGSGFIVRDDGLIATNYHVIKTATKVEVLNPAIGSYWVRGVVAVDRELDFVVLKIGEQNLPTLPLGNSGQVRLGEGVVAIGNPKGLSGTVSAGLISQFRNENSVR